MGHTLKIGKNTSGDKYSIMDQEKFAEDGLQKVWSVADHITSNFLKAVFRKFYLVYSWTLRQVSMYLWVCIINHYENEDDNEK